MTTTPKPTLDERRDKLADYFGAEDMKKNSDLPNLFQDVHFKAGWDACRKEMQAEIEPSKTIAEMHAEIERLKEYKWKYEELCK